MAVLAGVRKIRGLLDVLDRDHAAQLEGIVDHQHLFDAMLVQQVHDLLLARVLAHGDQTLLGGHHAGDRGVVVRLEPQVTTGDDTDQLGAIDDRHARNAVLAGQVQHLLNRRRRRHRDRIIDHTRLEFLDLAHFTRLIGRRHILVDDAQSALLRQRDRQPGLGHRIHRRRQQRDVESNFARQRGGEVNLARQDV